MPTDTSFVGCRTIPSVALLDFSGFSAGLPPNVVVNWVVQSLTLSFVKVGLLKHRSGSDKPVGVTLCVFAEYKSAKLGALKPWPTEPRIKNDDTGCQRRLNFGVVDEPTPWYLSQRTARSASSPLTIGTLTSPKAAATLRSRSIGRKLPP